MVIKMTKNIDEANLITHNGNFHADEVMATVILGKLLGEITVCRMAEVPKQTRKNVLVYDMGFGRFDHHQKGGNGERKNGVPYASCGLIWKEFGQILLEDTLNPYGIWKGMDKLIFQGIDAVDNGVMPSVDYPAYPIGISQIIAGFNPTWNSEESSDEAFARAVLFAETIFDNEFNNLISKEIARDVIEDVIERTEGHIMVLEKYVPWQKAILWSEKENASNIWFVIFPSNRRGYTWCAVSDKIGSFIPRKSVPAEWFGLKEEELRMISGVKTATFCHKDGFIGGAETLEDTIQMVKIAINS